MPSKNRGIEKCSPSLSHLFHLSSTKPLWEHSKYPLQLPNLSLYFALFMFSPFGQAWMGTCGNIEQSVLWHRIGEIRKRSDVKERDVISDPGIYNSAESA